MTRARILASTYFFPVRVGSEWRKDDVVLAPHDLCRRLMTSKVFLPFRIKWQVGPIIVTKIRHRVLVSRTRKKRALQQPAVERNSGLIRHAVRVLQGLRLTSRPRGSSRG